jgi:hypothetical protein
MQNLYLFPAKKASAQAETAAAAEQVRRQLSTVSCRAAMYSELSLIQKLLRFNSILKKKI